MSFLGKIDYFLLGNMLIDGNYNFKCYSVSFGSDGQIFSSQLSPRDNRNQAAGAHLQENSFQRMVYGLADTLHETY